jgi:quinoprotein glucose dehydrogenase
MTHSERGRSPVRLFCCTCILALATATTAPDEWSTYGHDPGGQRFSPLGSIDRSNVGKLKVAWTFRTGDIYVPKRGRPPAFEATPLFVDGSLYLATPLGRVIALDPTTGTQRWAFDSHIDKDAGYGDFATRGLATWKPKDGLRRIYIATIDARLIALDGKTGNALTDFGDNGVVNLRTGLRIPPVRFSDYEETSAPAIIGQTIVVGSGVADNVSASQPSGEVRAFDAK